MKTKQILLVDDSHFFMQAMKEFLTRSGLEVLTAASGRETLKLLNNHTPHVILMDFHLSDISGDACCRQIKTNKATGRIPLIMLTTAGNSESIEMSRSAGCDDCLEKPLDKMALLTKVKRYMEVPTREHRRVPICVPVNYSCGKGECDGIIFCISEGGMFIKGEAILERGTSIKIRFAIPEITSQLEVAGVVAWNTDERLHQPTRIAPGFGVRFTALDDNAIEAIKRYVGLGDYLL
ncbi:MAG: response regulator [Deltaproteobacteria bacterium]|nr:response regulator [Deltaproteobacteria bacterium]